MKRFWIYFRGTRNGEYIVASSLSAAKVIFAGKHGVPIDSPYIAGSYKQA